MANADLTAQIVENGVNWDESTQGLTGTIKFSIGYNKVGADDSGLPKKGISNFAEFLGYKPVGTDKMICRRLRFGDPSGARGTREFETIKVTAEFSTANWLDGKCEESWEAGADCRDVSGGRVWSSDGAACDQPIYIIIPTARWKLTQVFGYSDFERDKLLGFIGNVNSEQYRGFSAGTLKFETPGINKYYDYDRKLWLMKVQANIAWRATPWTSEYRTGTGNWEQMSPALFPNKNYVALPFIFA